MQIVWRPLLFLLVVLHTASSGIVITTGHTNPAAQNVGNPIDDLLRQLLENFRAGMPDGFPDMGIPPLDPLQIDNLTIAIQQSGLSVFANVTTGSLTDLSTFVIDQLHVSLLTLKGVVALSLPELSLDAHYYLDGLIADLFPLYGGGPCSVKLGNLSLEVDADLNLNRTDQQEHIQISTMDFNLHVPILDIQMHGLFNSEEMATVLDGFADDVGPLLIDVLVNDTRRDLLPQIIDTLNVLLWNVSIPLQPPPPQPRQLPFGLSTSANADALFDRIIPYLQKFVVAQNLDPLALPEYDAFIVDNTGVKLYDGFLNGVASLHRGGSSVLAYDEREWLAVASEIHFQQLDAGYKLKIEIANIGPHVSAEIKLTNTKAKFNVKISSRTLVIACDQLEISDIGDVSVKIRGLPFLWEFLLGPLISLVVDLFKGQIADAVSDALHDTVADALAKIDLLDILENL